MAYVAVDKDGTESIHDLKPIRDEQEGYWASCASYGKNDYVLFPKGSIKKLIGRTLTWDDEPVELKEE